MVRMLRDGPKTVTEMDDILLREGNGSRLREASRVIYNLWEAGEVAMDLQRRFYLKKENQA